MKQYDYIIAGGGCAGLSLAYYLSQSALRSKRVLLIDAEKKEHNDRTWCFWEDQPATFEDVVAREWPVLSFSDEKGERPASLGSLRYKMIRGADFYRKVNAAIDSLPNFEFLQANITEMGDSASGAYVIADGRRFEAGWAFNSLFRNDARNENPQGHHFLLQHFVGWWIKCPEPVFDPGKATLMDFRTPQYRSTRFLYVLPFSEREALVEHTVFSRQKLHPKSYERALESYISDTLGVGSYSIKEVERGVIPMTDRPFPVTLGAHIINIGTAGGAVKPTTGYAFLNIQRQVKHIVAQLSANGSPLLPPPAARRFRFYDSILLNILQHHGEEGKPIFSALFRRNGMLKILRFLKEETSVWEEARIFASLPFIPFLMALLRVALLPLWRKFLSLRSSTGKKPVPDIFFGLGKTPKTNSRAHIRGKTL